MAEIVNLRQARKRKLRSEKEAQAEANRAAFGRPKAERRLGEAQKSLADRRLEGHRLEEEDGVTTPRPSAGEEKRCEATQGEEP